MLFRTAFCSLAVSGERDGDRTNRVRIMKLIDRTDSSPFPLAEGETFSLMDRLIRSEIGASLRDSQDFDDAYQDVWVGLMSHWSYLQRTYNPQRGEPEAWLRVVIHHLVVDRARRTHRVGIRTVTLQCSPCDLAIESTPEEDYSHPQMLAWMHDSLDELRIHVSEQNYRAFSLHWLDGLSIKEVAVRLDITPRQVQKRCDRLLARLRVMALRKAKFESVSERSSLPILQIRLNKKSEGGGVRRPCFRILILGSAVGEDRPETRWD